MTCPPNIRAEMARLCERAGTRTAVFSEGTPTHWNPRGVIDPRSREPFTPEGAWGFVREQILSGCEITLTILENPRGKRGWVFRFEDGVGERVYVKLQIISGKVFGRSFHK